jgi:beta-1,4-mannosyl-glycoprotein beta-1,4-N-acetylglucosaminyltransferase
MFYYFVNCLKARDWLGSRGCFYKRLRTGSPNYDRMSKDGAIILPNGGWHFSFLGGAERIRTKLESYGHQEYNTTAVKTAVEHHLQNNTDLFGRPGAMELIPISHEFLPSFLVDNIGRYEQFVRH